MLSWGGNTDTLQFYSLLFFYVFTPYKDHLVPDDDQTPNPIPQSVLTDFDGKNVINHLARINCKRRA